jgi:hypothetical protein
VDGEVETGDGRAPGLDLDLPKFQRMFVELMKRQRLSATPAAHR